MSNTRSIAYRPYILRPAAASVALGISRSTLYRLIRRGDLELVRFGERTSGITVSSIDRLIERAKQERAA